MPTNPAPERTIVVDGVRLTEAQVRAAVKALEVPPLLTRADIKPGEFFAYVRDRKLRGALFAVRVESVRFNENPTATHASVSRNGELCYATQTGLVSPVERRASFTDTGDA